MKQNQSRCSNSRSGLRRQKVRQEGNAARFSTLLLFVALFTLLILSTMTGCASTKHREEEDRLSALDEAQARMEKIETEEQDFDLPEPAGKKKKKGNRDSNGVPIPVTAMPVIRFSGRGVKVELEDMLLTNFSLFEDRDASSGYAAVLSDASSRAEFSITLPAGRYECLLAEKAVDPAHAAVSLRIDEDSYDIYPSDPPLGIWELTTRVPVYLDVPEERPYLITISSAAAGMSLDYIQFVRMQ